jgi:predicted MFS family arabinose efflux permease
MTVQQLYGPAYGLSVDVLRVAVLVPGLAWVSGNFRFGMIARGALRGELVASACGAATSLVAFALLRSGVGAWSATAVFCASETVTLLAAAWLWRRTGPRQPAGRPTKGA